MAWPPPTLTTTRTNTTVMSDQHPADHNSVNLAINDIVTRLRDSVVILTSPSLSVGSGSANDIVWSTEVTDLEGWHAAGSANLIVPPGKAGRYMISLMVPTTTLGAQSAISAHLNGAVIAETVSGAASAWYAPTLTFVRTLAAADTLKFQIFQSSGGAKTLNPRLEIC